MDSRLLAGAYSKRYKYIEREHIETLKAENDLQGSDVIAKARRLSQETNKRRKLLAQKRKQEAVREEKRRQEILNRRHQEQKQATEKYQRCHVGSRPRMSPRRRGHSPTRSHVNLDDALRLIRGGSASGGLSEQSRETLQRMYQQQQNGRDQLERSQVRTVRASSAGQRESRQSQSRPLSGRPLDASIRAQLMERSMQNLTSSRSRFEQQLEHHQQLLMEQQQKSLHDFNKAIRKEIDADTKVQGVEENEEQDVPVQSESLSSLDSLEDGDRSSLGNSLSDHQAVKEFQQVAEQRRDEYHTHSDNNQTDSSQAQPMKVHVADSGQTLQDRSGRPQSAKLLTTRGQYDSQRLAGGQSHVDAANTGQIIGPIPQGYYTPPAGVPPSSTPVIQGSLKYYADSLDMNPSGPERHVTIGTALRLPQQSSQASQPIKQPPPALQYDNQLLAHRRFEGPSSQAGSAAGFRHFGDTSDYINKGQLDSGNKGSVLDQPTSALTQNQHPEERPKAHIYAWSSPPPEEDGVAAPHGLLNDNSSNYSASMVADRVMATNRHPQTSRTISTAATTTWVCQTVNAVHTKEPSYSQASTNNNVSAAHQTSFGTQPPHAEIPRGQGQKPGTVLTSTSSYPATTALKFVATMPPSYQGHVPTSDNRQQESESQSQNQSHSGTGREKGGSAYQQHKGGSLSQGTLGLINGKLTTVNIGLQCGSLHEPRITVVEDEPDGRKEVRSILKRVNRDAQSKGGAGGQVKFNVQDSVEIAKRHMRNNEEEKRKKVQKKGVRFADLHYPDDVEEDTDSTDSMIDSSAAAVNTTSSAAKTASHTSVKSESGTGRMSQRSRPSSARVTSTTAKTTDNRSKAPRVASAGPTRHGPASRPKAAAHIIMSGDASSQNSHPAEASAAGITVHKSQLDKKVTLINNNFMSRVPVYTGATSSSAMAPTSTAAVYSVSGGKTGMTAGYSTSAMTGDAQSGEQVKGGRGKNTVPTLHSTTVLPSHSHFSNANNTYKAVYNENGMRIDRTPTDDEINNLWKNMRSMLDVSDGKGAPSTSTNGNNSEQAARQQVQVSHQYIDGTALGIPNGMARVVPGHTNTKSSTLATNGAQSGLAKSNGQSKNGYLQRYSLLQQRRNPSSGIGASSRANGVVEQTVQPMQLMGNDADPWHTAVNISYAPREEMSESMAGFLAAEQTVQSQGPEVRDSRVLAAMESAQNQQEMYNSIRQKVAKGGPSALSMEEHRLLESLDKLNERLKNVDNRQTTAHQAVNYSNNTSSHQVYVHGSGFRGHQVISSQSHRRNSAGLRSMGRPVSARLLTRPYH